MDWVILLFKRNIIKNHRSIDIFSDYPLYTHRNFFSIFSSKNILDIYFFKRFKRNLVTFRSRSNLISKKSTLIVELIRAETRVNILISGGVRAWTFPGPWRVQRERVSRSVMFATLWFLLVSWPLSQRWPTLYVERFLFKDE